MSCILCIYASMYLCVLTSEDYMYMMCSYMNSIYVLMYMFIYRRGTFNFMSSTNFLNHYHMTITYNSLL